MRDRLAAEYRAEADKLTSAMDDSTLTVTSAGTAEADWERRLRRAVMPAKRDAVLGLRHSKRIDDVVFRWFQARLDTEELQVTDIIDKNT